MNNYQTCIGAFIAIVCESTDTDTAKVSTNLQMLCPITGGSAPGGEVAVAAWSS